MHLAHRYFVLAIPLVAAIALLGAACGGDDDDGSTGTVDSDKLYSATESGATAAAGAPRSSTTKDDNSGGAANGPITADPQDLAFDRKIIFTTSLALQVPDITASFNQVQNIARVAGGYVENSNLSVSGDDPARQRASVTLRVPVIEYDDTLNSLRTLQGATVQGEEAKSNEVTEQYVDLQSRVTNLRSTEAQYLELLKSAKSIDEIMKVNDRLTDVRGQIEQAQGRLNLLDHMTELATINVSLTPLIAAKVEEPKKDSGISTPAEAFTAALEWSWSALRVLAAAGAVALVALAWFVPAGVVALVIRRFARGRRTATPMVERPAEPVA